MFQMMTMMVAQLPDGVTPSVNWGEWPIVAILLIVIGVLLWRFEAHLKAKDVVAKSVSDRFAEVVEKSSKEHGEAMKTVSASMQAIADSVREGDAEIVKNQKLHEVRIAVLSQAISQGEENIDLEKLQFLVDRILAGKL